MSSRYEDAKIILLEDSSSTLLFSTLLYSRKTNLQIDSVELVETGPVAAGGEAFEELAESNVVETVGAVEDDALLGHCLRQVFGRLGLSRPRGTLRSPAQMQMQSAEQRSEDQ